MSDSSLKEAHASTIEGLLEMIADPQVRYPDQKEVSLENLEWMCKTILQNIEAYPVDKQSRWIGFVQGVLAMRGILSVAVERDRTRPFFHAAYAAALQTIPPTRSMGDGSPEY